LLAVGLGIASAARQGQLPDRQRSREVEDGRTDVRASAVAGNNYLGGFPTSDALQPSYIDGFEGIVAKLTPQRALVYATYLGGASNDLALGIAVDDLGNAYVVGHTASTDFPVTPGAYQDTNPLFAAQRSTRRFLVTDFLVRLAHDARAICQGHDVRRVRDVLRLT
jgi:hypothetical protein